MSEKYERLGECNQCGLCCLISHKAKQINRTNEEDASYLDELRTGWIVARTTKTKIYLVRWDPCPYLTFDLRCRMHGKPQQPTVCRKFPFEPEGFYQVVKRRCSITFRRKKKETIK